MTTTWTIVLGEKAALSSQLVFLMRNILKTDSSLISALKSSETYSHVFRILVKCSDEELSSPQIPSKFSGIATHTAKNLRTDSPMPLQLIPVFTKQLGNNIPSSPSARLPSAGEVGSFFPSQLNGAAQAAMSALQQHLGEVIQQEVAHTEERVRQYTEQQYTALEEFRERAHREHRVLARLLFDAQENLPISPANLISLSTPPPTPDSCGILDTPRSLVQSSKGGGNSVMASAIRQHSATRKQPSSLIDTRQANRPSPLTSSPATGNTKVERRLPLRLFGQTPARRSDSFDTEGLFDLEGMEGTPTENFHSEDESDTDDSGSHDEGIHIPRGRSDSNSFLAKSLPVKVPTYLPSNKRGGEDGDDERVCIVVVYDLT
uniref:Uncharacterized protein n=1 Tax=Timema douglasi TaxID=61478 RepID=A0A7R8VMW2_TIMDO|nr:unnamed protein product [Timema douglasi]